MILNKTKGTIIAERKKVCNNLFTKFSGLMFRPETYIRRHSLIFEFSKLAKQPFHMFFVFYPIDIVFLDEKKHVVECNNCFMPFEIYYPKTFAKYALELPTGTIKNSSIELGDCITW